jgi:hypothetical protein
MTSFSKCSTLKYEYQLKEVLLLAEIFQSSFLNDRCSQSSENEAVGVCDVWQPLISSKSTSSEIGES